MNSSNALVTLFFILAATACGDVGRATTPPPDARDTVPDASLAAPTAIAADDIASFAALDGTPTIVPFAAVAYDDGRELDAHGRFTATASGDYEICASLAGPPTLAMLLELFVDGSRYSGIGSGTGIAHGCMPARIAAHQVVDVRVTQNSGSTQGFASNPAASWLTVHRETALVEATANLSFSVPRAAFVTVPYDTVIHDDRHEFDAATGQFIASVAGDYQFCASLGAPGGMGFELDLFKNEVRERGFIVSFGPGSGCRSIRLAVNDRVAVGMYQDLMPPGTIPPNPAWTRLTVAQLPTEVSLGDTESFSSADGKFVRVPYAAELVDDQHGFDLANHRYTVATEGYFEVCASILNIDQMPLPVMELDVFKNGMRNKVIASSAYAACGCRVMHATVGDTLEVDIFAMASNHTGNVYWNWMTLRRLQ